MKKSTCIICFVASLAFLIPRIAIAAPAQYAVDWHVVAAGGGASSNAAYAVTGTAGQPTTAHSESGRFAIDSGFWGFAAAVQTPGAPLLTIRSSVNSVMISWPSPSAGYILQFTTNLASANWAPVNTSPADDGATRSVIIPQATGRCFFRLLKPAAS
jgi:hypothetical protein